MNKINKLIGSLLLSAFMLVGVGVSGNGKEAIRGDAAGETRSISFGSASESTKIDKASVNAQDSGSVTWTIVTTGTTSFTQNPAYSQLGSSKKPASSIKLTSNLGKSYKIISFSSKLGGFSGTAGNISLKIDGNEVGSGKLSGTTDIEVASTKETNGTDLSIDVSGISKGVKLCSVSYTIEELATIATKISSADLKDSSKEFYCGDPISGSDFTVKDNTGAEITDFTIEPQTVPSTLKEDGTFDVTFSKEGLESLTKSFPGKEKVVDYTLNYESINGCPEDVFTLSAEPTPFLVNPSYTWSVTEGAELLTLSSLTGSSIDVTLNAIGTANIHVSESVSGKEKDIPVTISERVSTIKAAVENATSSTESKSSYLMRGKVIGVFGNSYAIQDGAYGIYVYNDTTIKPSIGDIVEVDATVFTYNNLKETKTVKSAKIDNTLKILEPIVSTDETTLDDNLQNTLFNLNDLTFDNGTYSTVSTASLVFTKGDKTFTYRTDPNLDDALEQEIIDKITEIKNNKDKYIINLKNVILSKYNQYYQFKIPNASCIELVEKKLVGIEASLKDSTKTFIEEQKVSLSDLIINNKYEGDIVSEAASKDYTISPSLNDYILVSGENRFVITSTIDTTISTELVINAVSKTVTSIAVSGNIVKEYIQGDTFSLTGTWTATYDNGTTKELDLSELHYEAPDMSTVGTKTINVTYTFNEKTVSSSYSIEVKERVMMSNLKVDIISNDKSMYFIGENFDSSNYKVTLEYSNGTTKDVTNSVTWEDIPTFTETVEIAAAKVSYTEGGVTITNTDGALYEVYERVVGDILIQEPTKLAYTTSDTKLDLSGMYALVSYTTCERTDIVEDLSQFEITTDVNFKKTVSAPGLDVSGVFKDVSGKTEPFTFKITITYEELTIKIMSSSGASSFEKVTSTLDDYSGEYLIVYEEGSVAFNGVDAAKGNYAVSITDGKIAKDEKIGVTVTIAKMSSGDEYSIKINGGTNDGKYIGQSSDANGIVIDANNKISNTIEITSGSATIVSGGAYLRYNANSGQERFRYYKSSSYTNQKAVQLYKLTDGPSITDYKVSQDLFDAVVAADKELVCGNSSNGWNGTYNVEGAKEYLNETAGYITAEEYAALQSAVADENGNLVEQFLWKYDYLVSAGKIDNFLGRSVTNNVRINSFLTNMSNDTTTSIIVIVSLVSITSIGGYFFIRKRKEQ